MTRVWEPIVIGAFTAIVGVVAAADIPALYWLGYVLGAIGGWFLVVGAVALGVQIGNRHR